MQQPHAQVPAVQASSTLVGLLTPPAEEMHKEQPPHTEELQGQVQAALRLPPEHKVRAHEGGGRGGPHLLLPPGCLPTSVQPNLLCMPEPGLGAANSLAWWPASMLRCAQPPPRGSVYRRSNSRLTI